MATTEKPQQLNVHIDPSLKYQLANYCLKAGKSQKQAVDEALKYFLENEKQKAIIEN